VDPGLGSSGKKACSVVAEIGQRGQFLIRIRHNNARSSPALMSKDSYPDLQPFFWPSARKAVKIYCVSTWSLVYFSRVLSLMCFNSISVANCAILLWGKTFFVGHKNRVLSSQ
jgi:hypothetical protein